MFGGCVLIEFSTELESKHLLRGKEIAEEDMKLTSSPKYINIWNDSHGKSTETFVVQCIGFCVKRENSRAELRIYNKN